MFSVLLSQRTQRGRRLCPGHLPLCARAHGGPLLTNTTRPWVPSDKRSWGEPVITEGDALSCSLGVRKQPSAPEDRHPHPRTPPHASQLTLTSVLVSGRVGLRVCCPGSARGGSRRCFPGHRESTKRTLEGEPEMGARPCPPPRCGGQHHEADWDLLLGAAKQQQNH